MIVKKIDDRISHVISAQTRDALIKVVDGFDLEAEISGWSDNGEFVLKAKFKVKGAEAQLEVAKNLWNRYCYKFDLEPKWFNREFNYGYGAIAKAIGLVPTSRTKTIIIEFVSGRYVRVGGREIIRLDNFKDKMRELDAIPKLDSALVEE